jgi:hypothetical protein
MCKNVRNVKNSDIYTNIIPIYYLSKVTGLAPFSLAYTHDKHSRVGASLKTSVLGVLYTVLMIMWIIGAQCFRLISYVTDTGTFVTEGTKYVVILEFIICGITSITSLAMCLIKIRKEMDTLLYKVSVVDTLLDTRSDILRRNDRYLRMQVTLLVPILLIVYANDYVALDQSFNVAIVYYFGTSMQFVTITQFVNLISLLRQKMKILNRYLASEENPTEYGTDSNLWEILLQTPCFRNDDSWKDDAIYMEEFYQKLSRRHYNNIIIQDSTSISMQNSWLHKEKLRFRALRVIWDVLCDVSSSVNSMYGLQIFLCIVSSIVGTTTNTSYAIITLIKVKDPTNVEHYHQEVSLIIWALMQFLLLFWLTATCSAASGEANRSVTLLQKLLLLPELHPSTAAEIQLFLQQVSDLKITFTAWDVFTINNTFLGSTVGAITTILVMLVQFQAGRFSCQLGLNATRISTF